MHIFTKDAPDRRISVYVNIYCSNFVSMCRLPIFVIGGQVKIQLTVDNDSGSIIHYSNISTWHSLRTVFENIYVVKNSDLEICISSTYTFYFVMTMSVLLIFF